MAKTELVTNRKEDVYHTVDSFDPGDVAIGKHGCPYLVVQVHRTPPGELRFISLNSGRKSCKKAKARSLKCNEEVILTLDGGEN